MQFISMIQLFLFQVQNDQYKQNLLKLQNMVLVKFLNDTMVVPPDSEVQYT